MNNQFNPELDVYDMNKDSCKDLKIQLGLIKKAKPVNPLAPYKQMKRQPELFKRGTRCTFNSEKMEAWSYGWWRFVERCGKYIVFNNYRYSHTTTQHQWDTLSLMEKLGIKVDFHFECRTGFQSGYQTAIDDYQYKIKQLKEAIATPGTHKKKNTERRIVIEEIQTKIKTVKMLKKIKDKGRQ